MCSGRARCKMRSACLQRACQIPTQPLGERVCLLKSLGVPGGCLVIGKAEIRALSSQLWPALPLVLSPTATPEVHVNMPFLSNNCILSFQWDRVPWKHPTSQKPLFFLGSPAGWVLFIQEPVLPAYSSALGSMTRLSGQARLRGCKSSQGPLVCGPLCFMRKSSLGLGQKHQ